MLRVAYSNRLEELVLAFADASGAGPQRVAYAAFNASLSMSFSFGIEYLRYKVLFYWSSNLE